MKEQTVELILWVGAGYLLIGLAFALVFVTRGAARLDPAARESGWGFKFLILPGSMALWPLLLRRWLGGQVQPPTERGAHRGCNRCGPKGGIR